ncbi:MAG TPA: exopolysaccharide biosynthesis polyprenyl glycosylphosphotransferase, partial [Bacteroidota bacterium]|nr:exopolysaccharide biosynthesis polyprenyl glycosylphosphotransferase [Bacteroidota bacterium]
IVSILFGRIFIVQIEKSMYRRGHDLRNAVIIGDNETANRIYRALNNHPLLGYKLIGYFADTLSPIGEPLHKSTLLGTIQDAPKKLIKNNVELALISLNSNDHIKLHQLVQGCEGIDVEFMMVPDILELMASPDHVRIRELEGIPFIKIKGIPMTTWGRISKRAFDVTTSSILLLLFSPILLLIAVAIKLESKGSPLFRQDRLGMDGKSFSMLKFRSMKAGAEQLDHKAGLGITNDPRQTRVGKFLRRLSLDELPQLINVLKGEMSLVGPRPERPYYVDQFKSVIPKYLDRHRVKTGMTGWAQVNGFRGNSSLEERVKYDIYYIENWSLWFDIKILLKTIRALF